MTFKKPFILDLNYSIIYYRCIAMKCMFCLLSIEKAKSICTEAFDSSFPIERPRLGDITGRVLRS